MKSNSHILNSNLHVLKSNMHILSSNLHVLNNVTLDTQQGVMEHMASKDQNENGDTAIATKPVSKTKKPNLYRVLLLNDDFTPMEFVIMVLESVFKKGREEATTIMLHVHHNGVGECGVFPYEIAETKVTRVMELAQKHQHPLQCVMEKK